MFYERTYKRIQDTFSYIGGVNNIINFLAILINRLYNKFITLCDTKKLLLSLINSEKINKIKSIKIKNLAEENISNNSKKSREILNLNNMNMNMKEDINEKNKSDINCEKSNNFFILNNYNNIPDKIKKKLINDEDQNINKIKKNNIKEKKENFFSIIMWKKN